MTTFGQYVFSTAIDGGIGYFATVTDLQKDAGEYTAATVEDAEGEDAFPATTVRADQMEHAANAMIQPDYNLNGEMKENIRQALRDRDAGMIDAYDAQAIFQQAAFGEQVFG